LEAQEIIHIGREALWVLLKTVGPVLAIAFFAGFIISLFQALTQMQEMTLSFVPKILLMVTTLIFLMPYMINTMTHFAHSLFHRIVSLS
jgi:flagellar biosynthesis protein FliQ